MSNVYTTKNYIAHGGDEWVVGGKLTFLPGAVIDGADLGDPSAGNVEQLPFIPDSTATTVAAMKENFNALLAALRTAGLMARETVAEPDPENGDGNGDTGT